LGEDFVGYAIGSPEMNIPENLDKVYQYLLDFRPYPHQIAVYKALAKGHSVILRAPTGSGKSEAVFASFMVLRDEQIFPKRFIHTLPLRALVNSLEARYSQYAKKGKLALRVRAQHGARPESSLFYTDVLVATIDQLVTSYACAPLSLSVRFGNIPAGAVPGSLIVFDEVQTLDPRLGLQSTLILSERQQKLDVPFVVMTATLPSTFINKLAERFDFEFIDVDEASIESRAKREVVIESRLGQLLTVEEVLTYHHNIDGRLLVVTNTVDRAMNLYRGILQQEPTLQNKIMLIHSRFLDDDRQAKEIWLNKTFGKDYGAKQAILIATQVIEAGLDISADVLLTELSPADSLVQRAGRCARWGGKGKIIIFDVPNSAPYEDRLMLVTREVLAEISGSILSWENEKCFVDRVLGKPYAEYAEVSRSATVINLLSHAAFEGSAKKAEKAVRQIKSVELTIHDNPISAGHRILWQERIRINPIILARYYKDCLGAGIKPKLWRIEIDQNPKNCNDEYLVVSPIPITDVSQIFRGLLYVISSEQASYDSEAGLNLGVPGEALPLRVTLASSKSLEARKQEKETWIQHAIGTINAFENYILPQEVPALQRLAETFEMEFKDFLFLVKIVLALHDLGKLTVDWLKGIGATGVTKEECLAKSDVGTRFPLPPHSTVSAYAMWDFMIDKFGRKLGLVGALAIAHHHSVRATLVPKYRFVDCWEEVIAEALNQISAEVPMEAIKSNLKVECGLDRTMPDFLDWKAYDAYIVLSRIVRLSDWVTSGGGEDAIFCFQEWA